MAARATPWQRKVARLKRLVRSNRGARVSRVRLRNGDWFHVTHRAKDTALFEEAFGIVPARPLSKEQAKRAHAALRAIVIAAYRVGHAAGPRLPPRYEVRRALRRVYRAVNVCTAAIQAATRR